jgi:hypothetical protein
MTENHAPNPALHALTLVWMPSALSSEELPPLRPYQAKLLEVHLPETP